MRIDIVTVLPELLRSPFEASIMKRAIDKGLVEVHFIIYETTQLTDKKSWRLPLWWWCWNGNDRAAHWCLYNAIKKARETTKSFTCPRTEKLWTKKWPTPCPCMRISSSCAGIM
jgi:hypothetical protein